MTMYQFTTVAIALASALCIASTSAKKPVGDIGTCDSPLTEQGYTCQGCADDLPFASGGKLQ
jgi:hypothetical protein